MTRSLDGNQVDLRPPLRHFALTKIWLYVICSGWCDNSVMNSTTLFSMALGLQSPWQVDDISFSAD
ncbi:hypothetical protein, partial [Ferrovum myxofaciens]|uniref:hypothetical protein n=1 Tax=Ferrovum myxofaciens TaxID=416213 RepID=UPI0012375FB4